MKIIECPRDAMQGIKEFIPSNIKATYINALLKVTRELLMDFIYLFSAVQNKINIIIIINNTNIYSCCFERTHESINRSI
jgi:hypothetical protein